ncbi:MAG: hypothetical protein LBC49_05280 [Bacteroidales bacterium]|jgi:hypothetical protein|nr:hypothetical protein [Bacteroidales bacterium]
MTFDKWQEYNYNINPVLLWDYDTSNFDYQKGRSIVVERVLELGRPEDFYAMLKIYGGFENVRQIIKNDVLSLTNQTIPFVETMFNLKKSELRCYKRQQLRKKHLLS